MSAAGEISQDTSDHTIPNFRRWGNGWGLLEYFAVSVLSVAVFVLGTGRAILNLGSPWGVGDLLLGYAFTTADGVRGEASPQLGFPYGIDLRYFPGTELVQSSVAHWASWAFANPYLGINLVFVLSFPAAGAAALLAFRRMGMAPMMRIGIAVAFTALPFHLYRIEHIYLATLYPLPLGLAISIMILNGSFERSHYQSRARWILALLLTVAASLAIAWGGIYWTLFAALLISIAAIMRIIRLRSASSMWGLMPLAVIASGVLIALIPTLLIPGNTADTTFQRFPFESVLYSGQFIDAVLPATASRLPLINQIAAPLAQITDWANSAGVIGVRWNSDYGTLFTFLGILALFFWAVGLYPKPELMKSDDFSRKPTSEIFTFIALSAVIVTLFLVPFGLNVYFASVVTPQFRGWDRLVPLLQLLLISALGLYVTLLFGGQRRLRFSTKIATVAVSTAVIFLLLVFDSVLPARIYWHNQLMLAGQKRVEAQSIVESVNEVLGSDCGVLTLPFIRFPESGPVEKLGAYDPLWLGLEGRNDSWSVGGIANSAQGNWLAEISPDPLPHVAELRSIGFCGILLDSRGYTDEAFKAINNDFSSALGQGHELGGNNEVVLYALQNQ